MTLTNASIMFTAFIISTVAVIIVFVSGMTSGVVRMNTLLMRTFFAFFMTGAATYFLLMLFDWYYEKQHKKFAEVNAESEPPKDEVDISAEAETKAAQAAQTAQSEQSPQPAQPTFQPMNFGGN